MKFSGQSGIACLPVTALHIVNYEKTTVFLSGSGSYITIHDSHEPTTPLQRLQVFDSQCIHGITSCNPEVCEDEIIVRLLIWGGRLICVASLFLATNSDGNFQTARLAQKAIHKIDDWVLNASVDSCGLNAILLTAHNVLHRVCLISEPDDSAASSKAIAQGLSALLYSGKICVVNASHIIVTAGTVFGEIVVWTCSRGADTDWRASIRHIFLGHQGSIFGVCISDVFTHNNVRKRLIASCSDDRTIRVWDISDCDAVNSSTAIVERVLQDTGFGVTHDQDNHLAIAWGHHSRIWGIYFLPFVDTDCIAMVSRGEDGFCQFWTLKIGQTSSNSTNIQSKLRPAGNDRHHFGKNVWSLAYQTIANRTTILTGGADGRIVSRKLNVSQLKQNHITDSIAQHQVLSEKPTNLLKTSESASKPAQKSLKQFLCMAGRTIVATSDTGNLLIGNVDNLTHWSIVFQAQTKSSLILAKKCAGTLAFFGYSDGSIAAYDITTGKVTETMITLSDQPSRIEVAYSSTKMVCLMVIFSGKTPPSLLIIDLETRTQASQTTIWTPSDFVFSSVAYNPDSRILFCGSRAGSMAIFCGINHERSEARDPFYQQRVHGSDSVTSISKITNVIDSEIGAELILTTGRDGSIAIHRLAIAPHGREVVQFETVHRSNPPLGPNIEGATISRLEDNKLSLTVHGFTGKQFVIWDETNQTQLTALDCGGAHRSWTYYSSTDDNNDAFLWTQAGNLHATWIIISDHRVLQSGGHGREMKAVAITTTSNKSKIIATGAEDTNIRLFRSHDSAVDLNCISVLKKHNAGIQHLQFSTSGNLLFSSAGVEEFFVWKLTHISEFGIGTVLLGQLPQNVEDSDARIMSFDVVERKSSSSQVGETEVTILMAYSNGKAKYFSLKHNKTSCTFEILNDNFVGNVCLTQAQILRSTSEIYALVGATDGCLRIASLHPTPSQFVSHRVHQSNVAAMEAKNIVDDAESAWIVVTGGDDNALSVTLMMPPDKFKTFTVPKAHAAALTAVKIIQEESSSDDNISILMATAGNDQKVKLWKMKLQKKGTLIDQIDFRLTKIAEYWTDVADVSEMELLGCSTGSTGLIRQYELLVVGVGMQVVRIDVE